MYFLALCSYQVIITLCISDLQALDDLLVFYYEYQKHELEYKYITRLLFVLDGLYILYIF